MHMYIGPAAYFTLENRCLTSVAHGRVFQKKEEFSQTQKCHAQTQISDLAYMGVSQGSSDPKTYRAVDPGYS